MLAAQTAVMVGLGPLFGLTRMQAVRSGLLLAAGGEFAFVALCAFASTACSVSMRGASMQVLSYVLRELLVRAPSDIASKLNTVGNWKLRALGLCHAACSLLKRGAACTVMRNLRKSHVIAGTGGSGEAMAHGLVSKALVSELFLVVALTMALTPFLAELGARLGKAFESSDFKVRAPALLYAPTRYGSVLVPWGRFNTCRVPHAELCLGAPAAARRGCTVLVSAQGA